MRLVRNGFKSWHRPAPLQPTGNVCVCLCVSVSKGENFDPNDEIFTC